MHRKGRLKIWVSSKTTIKGIRRYNVILQKIPCALLSPTTTPPLYFLQLKGKNAQTYFICTNKGNKHTDKWIIWGLQPSECQGNRRFPQSFFFFFFILEIFQCTKAQINPATEVQFHQYPPWNNSPIGMTREVFQREEEEGRKKTPKKPSSNKKIVLFAKTSSYLEQTG